MVKIAVNNVAITAMKPAFVTDLLVDVTMDVNQGGKALGAMKVSVNVVVLHFVLKHKFV